MKTSPSLARLASLVCLIPLISAVAWAAPSLVYVDPAYTVGGATITDADPDTAGNQGATVGTDAFATISLAVAAVASNGTVKVHAGTYNEQVNVTKPLTLSGANAGVHPVVGANTAEVVGTRGAESILSHNGLYAIRPGAANITIDGFKFTGTGSRIINLDSGDAPNMRIANNIFANTSTADNAGVIQIVGSNLSNLTLEFNSFIHRGLGYAFYPGGNGDFTGVRIANNYFNCPNMSVFWVAAPLVNGVVANNEFDGTIGGVSGAGAPLMNIGQGGNIAISDNFFHDVQSLAFQVGIIGGSVVRNTFTNITPPTGGTFADAFQLWGGQFGTAVSGNVTIANNIIHFNDNASWPVRGVRLRTTDVVGGPMIDATTIHLNNNLFINGGAINDGSAVAIRHQGDPATAIDASGNYWGTTSETTIAALMSGLADFSPYLASSTDTDGVTAGFQGDFSSLYVTAQGSQTGATGRIQEGVNLASTGGTVNVNAGTYTQGASVNKTLTIRGAQFGVDATTGRLGASESVITDTGGAFGLVADGAIVDGFLLQGQTSPNGAPAFGYSVYFAIGYNGRQLRNCIVQNNVAGLSISNAGGAQAVVEHNLFRNNTQPGPASSQDIYADNYTAGAGMGNVLIQNNSFSNTSFVEDYWPIGIGNTVAPRFHDISVLNNTFSNAGRSVYFYGTDSITVTGNNITGANHYAVGLFAYTGYPSNSNATITNNTFGTNAKDVYLSNSGADLALTGSFTLTGNSFNGSTYTIYNDSDHAVDATANSFGGVLASNATTAQQFAIADTILDGVDSFGAGLVRTKAGQVFVTPHSFDNSPSFATGTTAPSIQRAVNIASPGDTINVQGGTYPGDVNAAGKTVTLEADAGFVAIGGNLTLGGSDTLVGRLNGVVAGTSYGQWQVNGTVALGGAALSLIGSDVPVPGQVFDLLQSTGAIGGIFSGLAEGNLILNFFGSGLSAQASYVGGTGHDFTLTVVGATVTPGGSLVIENPAGGGGTDASTVSYSAGNLVITDPNNIFYPGPGVTVSNGGHTITVPVASVSGPLVFNGTGGNDLFTFDFTGGSPIPPGGVIVNGGAGSDAMRIVGTGLAAIYTPSAVTDGDGVVSIGGQTITFTGLEPVDFNLPGGTFTLTLPSSVNVIDVANGFLTDGSTPALEISGTSGGVTFENARVRGAAITIDSSAFAGADTVTLTSANNAHTNTSLTINTGTQAGDVITVNGTATFSGAVTLNARTVNLNADITNAVAGTVATTVNVASPGQIQDGVDAAANTGATVSVGVGTFNELVTIGKSLSLLGAQHGVDARTGRSAPTGESIIDGTGKGGVLWVNGTGQTVTIDGFTAQGDVSISTSNNGLGAAITTSQSSNVLGLNILNNIIQHASIGIAPAGTLNVIQYNLIRLLDVDGAAAFTGIYTDFGLANSSIDSNKFEGMSNEAINIANVNSAGSGNVISNNVMDGQIYLYGNNAAQVTGNKITSSSGGGVSLGGFNDGISVTNNEVLGVTAGFGALRLRNDIAVPNQNLTITGNKFAAGAGAYGVRPGVGSYSGTLTLTNNQISGGAAAIDNQDAALVIDASRNFFGASPVPATVSATITGAGAANVDFTPLLTNDESNAAVGFQADLSAVTVHTLGTQVGATPRIQEGINTITTGGKVAVETGTYTESPDTSTKAVVLSAGSSVGKVTLNGNLTLDANDTLAYDINGLAAGTSFDQWQVSGSIALGGATLTLTGSQTVQTAQTYVLISNTGAGSATGTFSGHAQGDLYLNFLGSTLPAQINYLGGDGNDVAITVLGASVEGSNLVLSSPDSVVQNDQVTATFVSVGGVPTLHLHEAGVTLYAGPGVTQVGSDIEVPIASIPGSLVFSGGGGDDVFTLDFSAGNPIPAGGITYNGGAGGHDSLVITGGSTTTVTYNSTNLNDGSVVFTGPISGTINYTGLEPITDNMNAANRVFDFNGGAETIALTAATPGSMTISSTLAESVTFTNPTSSLTINAGTGDDIVNITTVDPSFNAALTIDGGAGNDTVNLNAGYTLAAGNSLSVTAEAVTVGTGAAFVTSGAGTIGITADSQAIDPTAGLTSAASVTLKQLTNATLINLGGADAVGTLGLTDAELDTVTTPVLNLGDLNSGAITVSAAITRPSTTVLNLTSSATITINPGSLDSSGGNVTLNGTNIIPTSAGTDVAMGATGTLAFGSGDNLFINISGTTADSLYTQLKVVGKVDLTGAALSFDPLGTYVPQPTDFFTIVDNDGTADAVTGTFAGMPQGHTFAFNSKIAAIHYDGGDGNDVVITIPPVLNSVTGPANGTYKESGVLTFTANYSKLVNVNTSGGTPTMSLTIGSTSRNATYVSGSGTANLVFQYTVVNADFDSDGIVVTSPIVLHGATIRDIYTNDAPLAFTSPNTTGVLVDGRVFFTAGSGSDPAPGTVAGGASVGTWESIRSGMVIADNGAIAFRAHLDTVGGVTASTNQGIWKSPTGTSASTYLLARSGSIAPDTSGSLFDILPQNPFLNDRGQASFVGYLRMGTGDVTATNDSGIWTELGTGTNGLRLMLRKGEAVTGGTVTAVAPSGWIGVSSPASDSGPAYAAFNVELNSTSTALMRMMVSTAGGITTVTPTTLVKEGDAAPSEGGTTFGTFNSFGGNSADPRMDSAGGVAFLAYLQGVPGATSTDSGIFYQSVGGSLTAQLRTDLAITGLGGEKPTGFERPTLSRPTPTTSSIAFRAFLPITGQTIWQGDPSTAALSIIAKQGQTTLPGTPAGSKLWSVWSPFSNKNGKVAFRVSLLDAGSAETRAIVTDTDGTLKVIATVNDVAPGVGENFANFDHPIIGDGDQVAIVASTATKVGIWRQDAGGGPLKKILLVGDAITSGTTTRTIASFIIIGTASDDRLNEVKSMDTAGQILVWVQYTNGDTGILLTTP